MKITICGSLDFIGEIKKAREQLEGFGHEVLLPMTAEMVFKGELSEEDVRQEKNTVGLAERSIKFDAINRHYAKIVSSDAVLVLNYEKKGIPGYIGGNTFLEIGFAFVNQKKIFLLNDIPDLSYSDEIRAMQPVVLGGDLKALK